MNESDVVYLKGDFYGQKLWNCRLMPPLYLNSVPMRVIRRDESGDVLVDPQGNYQSFWMQCGWLTSKQQ